MESIEHDLTSTNPTASDTPSANGTSSDVGGGIGGVVLLRDSDEPPKPSSQPNPGGVQDPTEPQTWEQAQPSADHGPTGPPWEHLGWLWAA